MLSGVLVPSRARLRARAMSLMACGAVLVGVGGCAAAGTSAVTASGTTLTIYASIPPGQATDPVVQDVLDAERLAFTQKQSEVTAFKLSFHPVQGGKISDNARTAIQNTSAIAYIGEILPGASADSLGITNAQDLLQVSPTDTAVALTQPTPGISNTPARYYESLKTYGRTFARVVPTTVPEAKAQVQEMQALGVKRLYVVGDASVYGLGLAASLRSDAAAGGISLVANPSAADGVFYAGSGAAGAQRSFAGALAGNPKLKLFAPSALADPSADGGLPSGKGGVYISAPGFLTNDLSPAGKSFVAAFRATYHRTPLPQAIFGYEAVAAVIDVLKEAGGSATNRATVVRDFLAIRNRSTVLGTYSLNANGDTNVAPFVFERWQSGALHPFKFVSVQG